MANKKDKDLLVIRDLKVSYPGAPNIIHDINVTAKAGSFYGLIGLNGAGKTTLIKTILGLRQYDEGDISIFKKSNIDKNSKRNIAFLPERFDPPWFLTGLEFLRFSTKIYGVKLSDSTFCEEAEKLALDQAALARKVETYSKGMRQKLGLLATILTGCSLLILDEPMSGLDPRARALVKDMLLQTKEQGRTIFLSSHILADMDEICDVVSVLHDRTILFEGTPAALKKEAGQKNLERAFLHFIEEKKAA
ncbi:MAG: ABC transporter ATP-binding protein [Alphaproteobacteria bacterium]